MALKGLPRVVKNYWRCEQAEHDLVYYEQYDSYFCNTCNGWLEPRCKDHNCLMCWHRPVDPRIES